eukprot:116526-Pelagomonas_calceolata.AAC.2
MLPCISANLPGLQKRTPRMGLPGSAHALQRSKDLGICHSNVARAPQELLSINLTLHQTLQICPQRGEVIATKSTELNRKPPKKRKRSRHRTSITPPLAEHNTTQ